MVNANIFFILLLLGRYIEYTKNRVSQTEKSDRKMQQVTKFNRSYFICFCVRPMLAISKFSLHVLL